MAPLPIGEIEMPVVVALPAQPVAMIPVRVVRTKIKEVMGPGIAELYGTLASQAIAPAGPWFTHHKRITPNEFDFEICIPVSQPVKPSGPVVLGERRACRAVQTTYRGPYEGLGPAWGAFMRWIEGSGLHAASDLYEVYAADPETSPSPEDWRTVLIRPLEG